MSMTSAEGLGTESGEPGSAATAMASTLPGADARTDQPTFGRQSTLELKFLRPAEHFVSAEGDDHADPT
jgi:hypothetical protein